MIAEDNLPDVLMIQESFRAHGYTIVADVFSDGAAAIENLRKIEAQEATRPDIVLLDINLPRVTGFQILSEIRRTQGLSSLPVVVMTSSDSASDRQQARSQLAGYFRKPNTYAEFMDIGRLAADLLKSES